MANIDLFFRNHLTLRHLRLLIALDDHRTIGKAANFLNVTQPAVSKTLSGMEMDLGCPLFLRTNRALTPTAEGECLIAHAREILSQIQSAHDDIMDHVQGKAGHVNIGAIPSAAIFFIPLFIALLQAEPNAPTVMLREGTLDQLMTPLRNGDLDMVLAVLPGKPLGAEFHVQTIFEDTNVAVVRAGHPLARAQDLDISALADFPLIMPPYHSRLRAGAEAILTKHRIKTQPSNFASVSTMANVGVLQLTDSIAFVSQAVARYFVDMDVLRILPLHLPELVLDIGLVRMVNHHETAAENTVVRIMKKTVDHKTSPLSGWRRQSGD